MRLKTLPQTRTVGNGPIFHAHRGWRNDLAPNPFPEGDCVSVDSDVESSAKSEHDEHLCHGDDAPCIQIRRLVSGLPPDIRGKRLFVILQVGVDETGYGQSGPHEAFIFAGYVGPVTHIEAFTHAWDQIVNIPPALTPHEVKKRVRLEAEDR